METQSRTMKDKTFNPPRQALMTDLYQLTMAAAYYYSKVEARATFELFVRKLPENRSYLIAAGIEQAVEYLRNLKFHDEEIDYLKGLETFKAISNAFWDYLEGFHFSGDVWAVPEGTLIFADEPILRLSAPIIEAQIVETFLLSSINFQTMVASKAARVVQAAQGKPVVDFGTRRAHGPEAGILAARASYIGGCIGTSNVEAGFTFGIPVFGTAAHSFTMAFDSEEEAFKNYYHCFPESTTLLIDTYDTIEGAKKACAIGSGLKGVRLDSGDILTLSKKVRAILNEAGLKDVKIVASGDLNEYKITELLRNGAAIDLFGVGTEMVTSKDAPALGGIYKLVECEKDGVVSYKSKFSEEKVTYPGSKQVFRYADQSGKYVGDVIGLAKEKADNQLVTQEDLKFKRIRPISNGLLTQLMKNGELISDLPSLNQTRQTASDNLARLPDEYKQIVNPLAYDGTSGTPAQRVARVATTLYPVKKSNELEELLSKVKELQK